MEGEGFVCSGPMVVEVDGEVIVVDEEDNKGCDEEELVFGFAVVELLL